MALTKVIGNGLGGTNDLTVDTTTLTVDATNDLVGIKTATPSDMYYNELVVNSGDEGGITILDTSSGQSALAFADGTSGDARYRGRILYDHSTDSLSIGTAGEQYWTMNSAHIITTPKQPAFLAKPSGDQSNIAEDSDVVVALATEIFDQNADFASNAFTAPVTGRYQISYNLRMSHLQTGANYYFIKLVTSNRTIISAYDPIAFDVNDLPYWTFTLSLLVDMDANDTCQLKVNQQGGGSAVSDIIAQDTYLSGYLVA